FLIYEHNQFIGHYYKIIENQSVVYGDLVDSKIWQGDQKSSSLLKQFLTDLGFDIEGLVQGYDDYPLTLAWGETVPLFYLPQAQTQRLIILGIPRSRHEKIYDMQETLVRLGQTLVEFCEKQEKMFSIIFSGDLSHTHIENGPYGYDPSSKEFDKLVQNWSKNLEQEIFDEILKLQKNALACGMSGISMINGIADKYKLSIKSSYYDLPTYFGMIVNHWEINT
ncbi:MAG: hypothetical protein ACC656_00390, partial [Candidatus Heimdallarchaeota archaeon]